MNGDGGSLGQHENDRSTDIDAQILRALEVIHESRSANILRQNASQYLEEVKSEKEAPYHGFGLASTASQPAVVRHFGLSLLDHAIHHRWADYTLEQRTAVRGWVLELAQRVADDDPFYIRNKIAELWVEIAKRSWVLDWMDMDELLVRLWDGSVVQKMLVLTILENLSEDIFGREDTVAGLRGTELNRACVDIFTPALVLVQQFPSRETNINVRFGENGWLSRIGDLLDWCTTNDQASDLSRDCVVKGLSTYKSAIGWIIPQALVTTHAIQRICACLSTPSLAVQLVGALSKNSMRSQP